MREDACADLLAPGAARARRVAVDRAGAPKPPFDIELAPLLARSAALTASILPEGIGALRKGAARLRMSDADLAHGGTIAITEHLVPVSGGAEIALLVLRPADTGDCLPGLCFLHGGGMVSGDARTGIGVAAEWVRFADLCVASVDYRLAPEHPHPVPVEDCYAALAWMDANRDILGLDASPILLAGASAGGGLAAGTALLARERAGPQLGGLLLMAPMLDDAESFPSSTAFHGDAPWDARSNRTGWSALLGSAAGGADVPPCAAPIRARDLAGLPPTFLDVGALETFRDETIAFAAHLAQDGTPTELHVWSGAFHGFDVLASESAVAKAARAVRLDWLKRLLRDRANT